MRVVRGISTSSKTSFALGNFAEPSRRCSALRMRGVCSGDGLSLVASSISTVLGFRPLRGGGSALGGIELGATVPGAMEPDAMEADAIELEAPSP